MKENPDHPRTVLCDDLLAPEGYGEIIGGSQREDDHDKLLQRIKEEKLPLDAYGWYLDLRKYGTFVHSGFGLGLERTVAWIFFSSRRRHTRCSRDWSSDMCSSDLTGVRGSFREAKQRLSRLCPARY